MNNNGYQNQSTLYLKATTVDCAACRALIAPEATTMKIVFSNRYYHHRVYAPKCTSVAACSAYANNTPYGVMEELTVKEGCTFSRILNCVESYAMSPANIVDVFRKFPAGSGAVNVVNKTYDALTDADKAIATSKGYTVTSVNSLS